MTNNPHLKELLGPDGNKLGGDLLVPSAAIPHFPECVVLSRQTIDPAPGLINKLCIRARAGAEQG